MLKVREEVQTHGVTHDFKSAALVDLGPDAAVFAATAKRNAGSAGLAVAGHRVNCLVDCGARRANIKRRFIRRARYWRLQLGRLRRRRLRSDGVGALRGRRMLLHCLLHWRGSWRSSGLGYSRQSRIKQFAQCVLVRRARLRYAVHVGFDVRLGWRYLELVRW